MSREIVLRAPGSLGVGVDAFQFRASMRCPTGRGVAKYIGAREALKTWEQLGNHLKVAEAATEIADSKSGAIWRVTFDQPLPCYVAKKTNTILAIEEFSFDYDATDLRVAGRIMIPGDDVRDLTDTFPDKKVNFSWRGLTIFGTCHGDLKTLAKMIVALDRAKVTELPEFPEEFDLHWTSRARHVRFDDKVNINVVETSVVDEYNHGGNF